MTINKREVNPCSICVVGPICVQGCDLLQQHIRKNLTGWIGEADLISNLIRRGVIVIDEDDKQWRWNR